MGRLGFCVFLLLGFRVCAVFLACGLVLWSSVVGWYFCGFRFYVIDII